MAPDKLVHLVDLEPLVRLELLDNRDQAVSRDPRVQWVKVV